MSVPFVHRVVTIPSIVALVLFVVPWPAAARSMPVGPTIPSPPWYVRGFLAALGTLVVGGVLTALAPGYVRRTTDRVRHDPADSFVWGLGVVVAVFAGVLVVGGVGTGAIAAPAVLIFLVVALVASVLGALAIGWHVTDDRVKALGIATVVAAVVGAVPIVGGVAGFVLSTLGIGAIVLVYRDEFDRELDERLAEPPTPHGAHIGSDTDGTSVTRFVVELGYWFDGTLPEVVRFVHDPESEQLEDDVTEAGLHVTVYRDGKQIRSERVTDPRPAEAALDSALSHSIDSLSGVIREFERGHAVREPMTSEEVGRAREVLRELRTGTRVALSEELGRESGTSVVGHHNA